MKKETEIIKQNNLSKYHLHIISYYIDEIEKDFKDLKSSIKIKNYSIATHYCSGINDLSKRICTILESYEK